MQPDNLAERIRLETQILRLVREALLMAVDAPIEEGTTEHWGERCRFLCESFERHVSRLFRIKWDVDDDPLLLQTDQAGLMDHFAQLEEQQREIAFELRSLANEARQLHSENPANLHAYRQRMNGFFERFDEMHQRECKLWLDAFQVDIGGSG